MVANGVRNWWAIAFATFQTACSLSVWKLKKLLLMIPPTSNTVKKNGKTYRQFSDTNARFGSGMNASVPATRALEMDQTNKTRRMWKRTWTIKNSESTYSVIAKKLIVPSIPDLAALTMRITPKQNGSIIPIVIVHKMYPNWVSWSGQWPLKRNGATQSTTKTLSQSVSNERFASRSSTKEEPM